MKTILRKRKRKVSDLDLREGMNGHRKEAMQRREPDESLKKKSEF